MKMILASMLVFSTNAIAATSSIYCKIDGKVYDAQSEEGFGQCYFSLTSEGGACFTGSRSEVIQIINADTFNWDENWLERANYKGSSEIFYVSVDGPNEESVPMSMKRCSPDFFQK